MKYRKYRRIVIEEYDDESYGLISDEGEIMGISTRLELLSEFVNIMFYRETNIKKAKGEKE